MNVIIVPWENKFCFPKPFSVPKRKTLRLLSFHWEITYSPRGQSLCVYYAWRVKGVTADIKMTYY